MLATPEVKCDPERVYEPSEDSFLLLDCLEKERTWLRQRQPRASVVCEVGCGSGVVTAFMMQHEMPQPMSVYLATDVSPWALATTAETVQSTGCRGALCAARTDLVTGLADGQVDVLVFNPPYVPAEGVPQGPAAGEREERWLEVALEGGADGMEVTTRMLGALGRVLASSGVAYILFCARNRPEEVAAGMRAAGWVAELVERRRAGWEVLSVYRFYRNS
ncbi:AGL186Cp [Eremothecium gossypii ATCC 10895]|uniref:AGL186Cp n=1 Tax=Eremothecium gossypii (strain ATCC 10895 / CBS 109.51 / FGSC 9923 / NRRL Y-1056) TaxID=284811 RepID=Q750X5_EREGS|nr:AGL186Cp [Eremothecium gossypii ATCC 10895]AAS54305.1 AGL186Cp [Eremothecium gossypii ATCC 10895]AEY98631.1 FAGL186Cp [Eremothecium gossypii FDAG1]